MTINQIEKMSPSELHQLSTNEFELWAESLANAGREGVRYERWWVGRLAIEEIGRQNRADQIERGKEALAFGERLRESNRHG